MIYHRFFKNTLYALDLDGVLIDSIEECYVISKLTYHGKNFINPEEKKLFYKYRGLVQPAYEYYYLMRAIGNYLNQEIGSIEKVFTCFRQKGKTKESAVFEKYFFENRRQYEKNKFYEWMVLNPLTDYGRYVQNINPKNILIITTKNTDSAKIIIDYYNINPIRIYGNEDVEIAGSKGALLDLIIKESVMEKMVFIDDSIEHLQTVENKNIKCIFANWGYSNYKNYNFENSLDI